jgi:hypothetical protein
MRAIASSMMAALVVIALLFGNCLSCPQMLTQDAHRCCHHGQPVTAKCQTQSLQHFVKSEAGTETSPAPATAEIVQPAPVALLAQAFELAVDPSKAPPDPPLLTSSLRI